jgi:hypothetical protein
LKNYKQIYTYGVNLKNLILVTKEALAALKLDSSYKKLINAGFKLEVADCVPEKLMDPAWNELNSHRLAYIIESYIPAV